MPPNPELTIASGRGLRALLSDEAVASGGPSRVRFPPAGFELKLDNDSSVLFVPGPNHTGITRTRVPAQIQSLERLEKALTAFSSATTDPTASRRISKEAKQVAAEVRQRGRATVANKFKVMSHAGGYTFELPGRRFLSIITPADVETVFGWVSAAAGDTPAEQSGGGGSSMWGAFATGEVPTAQPEDDDGGFWGGVSDVVGWIKDVLTDDGRTPSPTSGDNSPSGGMNNSSSGDNSPNGGNHVTVTVPPAGSKSGDGSGSGSGSGSGGHPPANSDPNHTKTRASFVICIGCGNCIEM